jgi:hypothetical protein
LLAARTDTDGKRREEAYRMRNIWIGILAGLALAAGAVRADVALYSSTFRGSSGANLHGQPVDTSGATASQHARYGTRVSATWAADWKFKADGSFAFAGAAADNRRGASIPFTPQNGYEYTLRMTTDFAATAAGQGWYATGYFMAPHYAMNINLDGGATVWALTRPGETMAGQADQAAHFELTGGTGVQSAARGSWEDTTAPSTLSIVLDTTGGTGNWSARYYAGEVAPANLMAEVADLNDVHIESVGIGVSLTSASTGRFQSFALRVAEPAGAMRLHDRGGGGGATGPAGPADGTVTNGLVAWYPLDETAGLFAKSRIGGPAGVLKDGAIWWGGGAWLDGEKAHVQVEGLPPLAPTAVTVAAWIRPDSFREYGGIAVRGIKSSPVALMVKAEGSIAGSINNLVPAGGPQGAHASSARTLSPKQWNHAAMTYDGACLRLYVNGELDAKSAVIKTTIMPSTDPLFIGVDRPGAPEFFRGAVRDLRIYGRALHPGLVKELAAMRPPEPPAPKIIAPDPDGGVELWASQARLSHTNMAIETKYGLPSIGNWGRDDVVVGWDIETKQGGLYDVWVTYDCPNAYAGGLAEISAGGSISAWLEVSATGGNWGAFREVAVNRLELPPGRTVVRVSTAKKPRQYLMNLRLIRMRPAAQP